MLLIFQLLSYRKVISQRVKTVGITDVEAERDLISDQAPILNTPSSNPTRAPVPGIALGVG